MNPMLLPQEPLRVDDLKIGRIYYVQPKLDGIRLLIDPVDGIFTRSGKRIPSAWLESQLWNTYLRSPWNGVALDGEIMLWNSTTQWWDPFNTIQSVVMSKTEPNGDYAQAWRFMIFDTPIERTSFVVRWDELTRRCEVGFENRLKLVDTIRAGKFRAEEIARGFVDRGYEGAVIRDGMGWYKHGRATYASGLIYKYVDWIRDEAEIVSFQELETNLDTSCTRVDNRVPMNTLGALIVRHPKFGRFNIGTGFSEMMRRDLWARRMWLLGSMVTFKYRPGHIKDAPCPAVFVGIRERE